MRQVFSHRFEKRIGIEPRHRWTLLAVGSNCRGVVTVAHHAFEIAGVADGELHLLRPFGIGTSDGETIELRHLRAGEDAFRGLEATEVAALAKVVFGEALAPPANSGAVPDLGHAL